MAVPTATVGMDAADLATAFSAEDSSAVRETATSAVLAGIAIVAPISVILPTRVTAELCRIA